MFNTLFLSYFLSASRALIDLEELSHAATRIGAGAHEVRIAFLTFFLSERFLFTYGA